MAKLLFRPIATTAFTILLTSHSGLAQTGPAGIGDTSGSSELVLWLDANTLGLTNGANVTSWSDLSGYGNDASAVGGNEPVFTTGVSNGFPAVRFTASNTDYLRVSDDASLRPNAISLVIVGSYTSASSLYSPFIIKTNNYDNWDAGYGIAQDNGSEDVLGFVTDWAANFVSSGLTYDDVHVIDLVYNQARVVLFFDENNEGGDPFTSNITNTTNFLYLGISPDGSTGIGTGVQDPLDGDIFEAIVVDRGLNRAERIILNNSLAAKYGLSLTVRDCYDEDALGFDYEVAGIGQANNGDNQTVAQGTGPVQITSTAGLGNNEFLIWGHDNGVYEATETVDVPAGIDRRITRIWAVSERNANNTAAADVGTVSISFDLTGLGAVTASDLRLLVDPDADGFDEAALPTIATDLGSNIYEFAGITALTDNDRFTLGTIDETQTPLPIELVYFNASSDPEGSVKLTWQTAKEVDNEFFTIERSIDGEDWNAILSLDGAGNSNEKLVYDAVDRMPLEGLSYYRLKQTDFDGTFTYSRISSVYLEDQNPISVFPNPTDGSITIVGSEYELSEVHVINSLGHNVSEQTWKNRPTPQSMTISLKSLKGGLYLIKTKTATNRIIKK